MAASALCRVVGDDEDELLGERSYMLRSALEDIDHGHCNARPAAADDFASSKKTRSGSGKLLRLYHLVKHKNYMLFVSKHTLEEIS